MTLFEMIVQIARDLLRPVQESYSYPQVLVVSSFNGQSGTAVIATSSPGTAALYSSSSSVTILSRNLRLSPGVRVVGVPIGQNTYYVVGVI